jgi:hypothetical protein
MTLENAVITSGGWDPTLREQIIERTGKTLARPVASPAKHHSAALTAVYKERDTNRSLTGQIDTIVSRIDRTRQPQPGYGRAWGAK